MEQSALDAWVDRCARRIVTLDQGIAATEAEEIARAALTIERLRVMEPEAAVDFVVAQIASGQPSRYERRSSPR